ncbi:hypothetical protein NEOLEDRAFT_517483 [Neolentinus lepideus HHB14362 ss-1]|uniref:Uncharacterized protein n=1 Tax=Neolentinus lepideus HHB14362 ss-1 TaxID=1314782 RepID=A0A165RHM0_9AGAM|nr:hypothetical protein NEOLEDRAFT_517483 [Neolentinus lepideus HHB14362 ss-1]
MSDRALERSLYVGICLNGVLYGFQLIISFLSTQYLVHSRNQLARDRERLMGNSFYIVYTVILLFCVTWGWAMNALMGQLMWIEHRDFPGGPVAYMYANSAAWFDVIGSAMPLIANIMSDGLLIYRCYILWYGHPWLIVFPSLVYLASAAMGIIATVESALPGSNFFQEHTTNFAIPWVSLSCALNAIVTILIASRILSARREIRAILPSQAADQYTGIVALLVESAFPFTAFGIFFAVTLGQNSPLSLVGMQMWGAFIGISPQLIILRVAMGRAWTRDTTAKIISHEISFATRGPVDTADTGMVENNSCTDVESVGQKIQSDKSQDTLAQPV